MKIRKIDISKISIALNRLEKDWRDRISFIKLDDDGNNVYEYKSENKVYRIEINNNSNGILAGCSCPYGTRSVAEPATPCKHVAAIITMENENISVIERAKDMVNGKDKLVIWASSLPRIVLCPASLYVKPDEMLIKSSGKPAKLGSAVHEVCENMVNNNLTSLPDLKEISVRYEIEDMLDELRMLSNFALTAWNGGDKPLKSYFRNPKCEERNTYSLKADDKDIEFVARSDIEEIIDDRGVVVDWKSGYKQSDYIAQVKCNAFLLAAKDKTIKEVSTIIVWLRDRTMSVATFTREELRNWMRQLIRRVVRGGENTFGPGEACLYCPRALSCPARKELSRGAIELFSGSNIVEAGTTMLADPEKVYRAYTQAKMVQSVAKQFLAQLKEEIVASGPLLIPGQEGRAIGIKTRKGKSNINAQAAWPIIAARLNDEEFAPCVTINKTKLTKAVMDKPPKGQKRGVVADLLRELEEANAIKREKDVEILTEIEVT